MSVIVQGFRKESTAFAKSNVRGVGVNRPQTLVINSLTSTYCGKSTLQVARRIRNFNTYEYFEYVLDIFYFLGQSFSYDNTLLIT